MAQLSGMFSVIKYWGSFNDTIIGDDAWVHSSLPSEAGINFVRGNIGIKISKT